MLLWTKEFRTLAFFLFMPNISSTFKQKKHSLTKLSKWYSSCKRHNIFEHLPIFYIFYIYIFVSLLNEIVTIIPCGLQLPRELYTLRNNSSLKRNLLAESKIETRTSWSVGNDVIIISRDRKNRFNKKNGVQIIMNR